MPNRDPRYASKLYDVDEREVERELASLPTLDDWPGLDDEERAHRERTLDAIAARVREDGPHIAMPTPERGRQFMPFAALKGYDEMLRDAERRAQEWTGYDAPDAPEKPAFGHGAVI